VDKVLEIASNVSTPLALGGFLAAVLFWIFRQIVAKDIFPKLNAAIGAEILKLIIERLFVLALIAMVLGFVGYIVVQVTTPLKSQQAATFPPRFDDLRSADLRISEVDDYLRISINGEALPNIVFGKEPGPISILRLLRRGHNVIAIGIDNSHQGGCGARIELWMNGQTDPDHKWYWSKDIDKAPANANCFTVNKSINLSQNLHGQSPGVASLKRSANGRPPGPVWRYAVHFRQPGPGVLPSSPA
jgi:hypothetical protein